MATAEDIEAPAAALHERALVVNGLCGSMAVPKRADAEFALPEVMRRGGVTAVNLTISVHDGFRQTCTNLSHLLKAVDRSPGTRVARSVEDIAAAKRERGAAIILGFQNSDPIE